MSTYVTRVIEVKLPDIQGEVWKEEKLQDIEVFQDHMVYKVNSDREMTRVDIVVLCSLFKLLKRRYPSINTFTLDEVISTLDNSNSGAVLEFLKVFAKDNKLNCFVVSHTDLYLENFDEIIDVEKHNGFSRFNIMLTSK